MHTGINLWKFNTWTPIQYGHHFPGDIFKCIFSNENVWISIKISPKIVPKCPTNNIPALVQIMTWHQPGDKPLSEPMTVNFWRIYASLCLNGLSIVLRCLLWCVRKTYLIFHLEFDSLFFNVYGCPFLPYLSRIRFKTFLFPHDWSQLATHTHMHNRYQWCALRYLLWMFTIGIPKRYISQFCLLWWNLGRSQLYIINITTSLSLDTVVSPGPVPHGEVENVQLL